VSQAIRRAPALSPEARRQSIIEATVPLLRIHGKAVTTAQIALAAGIAEGTLFRVFEDKDSLVRAAIASAVECGPAARELERIDRSAPLRAQLVAAVDVLQRRVERIWPLIALGLITPPMQQTHERQAHDVELHTALQALLEPYQADLRCAPAEVARVLRMLAFAGTHPRLANGVPLTAGEIVAIVLDGVRARPDDESTDAMESL
jgi:AcrR family transcriptional regulator